MGVYDADIAAAQQMIAEAGQSVTWHKLSDGAPPDANKPWLPSSGVPVNYTVNIVFLPIDRVNERFLQALRGTEIPSGSFQGLMGAVDFIPSIKDKVTRNGVVLQIRSIDTLAPNGDPILHTIEFIV